MTLKEWQLRCLRIRVARNCLLILTDLVSSWGLLSFAYSDKQIVFLMLKRCVTVLQQLNAIRCSLLLSDRGFFLLRHGLLLALLLLLLFLIGGVIGGLL